MVEVILSDYALTDMEDIYDFIAKNSIYYAEKQIAKFFDRIEVLHTFPLSGKVVPEYNIDTVREFVEGNYRIMYRIHSDEFISILTVHHGARLF